MNYLAHLFLSEKPQGSLLGNLMGDFIKGNTFEGLTKQAICGIKLHRGVDQYTDSHSDVAQSKKRISPERRRYAGILVDVFYDHFLVKHWKDYSTTDFSCQITDWYALLSRESKCDIPEKMQSSLQQMVDEDWLRAYGTAEGIDRALSRISGRIRFKNNLADGGQDLRNHYGALETDFRRFFPQLMTHVQALKKAD